MMRQVLTLLYLVWFKQLGGIFDICHTKTLSVVNSLKMTAKEFQAGLAMPGDMETKIWNFHDKCYFVKIQIKQESICNFFRWSIYLKFNFLSTSQ